MEKSIDLLLEDLKCSEFISRQFVKGKRRESIKSKLKYCKVSNFETKELCIDKMDTPLIPSNDDLRKIKSEDNPKSYFDVIENIGENEFSIISLGYNFTVEINKISIIEKHVESNCPPFFSMLQEVFARNQKVNIIQHFKMF